jgi:hypothetical protein
MTMSTITTTVAATLLGLSSALASGPAAAAGPIELAPLQGYAIPLGGRAAAVYFREHDGRKELVTTIGSADFATPAARRVTVIEPGASATFPLLATGPVVLTATDHGARLIIDVGVDLSPDRKVAEAAIE